MSDSPSQSSLIYILDDEIITVRRLVHSLSKDGYKVEGFSTAADFLLRLHEQSPDVVITDVRLNDADGVSLVPQIKNLSPRCQIILITGYATVDQAVQAIKTGAFHYLAKPFRLEELRHTVSDALKKTGAPLPLLTGNEAESSLASYRFGEIIGASPAMQEIFTTIKQVAGLNCNVLIQGESGTGKELVARALHKRSTRSRHPFIPFNCGAFSEELVANELFGHEKGAFTGAVSTKLGLLETANGGTIFLDEVGEMPLSMQIKLLRVIQERTLLRVGGIHPVAIDVRIIAATNRQLDKSISTGEFRQDLYYRLKVVSIELPPLRQRQEDIPLLSRHFAENAARQFGKPMPHISSAFYKSLVNYPFPGNVRELQNIIERAVALATEPYLDLKDLPPDIALSKTQPSAPDKNDIQLKTLQKEHIAEVYRRCGYNQTETAQQLGISRTTLWRRLKELGLIPDRK